MSGIESGGARRRPFCSGETNDPIPWEGDPMREMIEHIETWKQQGEEIALATVVSAGGSTPRPIGAKMIVSRSGKMQGSVSGGCVEGAVVEHALEVLDSSQPKLVHFGISDEMAWDVGLSCGGEIEVFIEPLAHETAS